MAPEHPVWVRFARAMVPLTAGAAAEVAQRVNGDSARPIRVLDISASHGLFGLAFARRNPAARVVALDWPNVLEVARENAQKAGVGPLRNPPRQRLRNRLRPRTYDVVLLPNFLHHFDVTSVRVTAEKGVRCPETRRPGRDGRVHPQRRPRHPSRGRGVRAHDAHHHARRRRVHRFAELESMLRNAGFAHNELHALKAGIQQVVISS